MGSYPRFPGKLAEKMMEQLNEQKIPEENRSTHRIQRAAKSLF